MFMFSENPEVGRSDLSLHHRWACIQDSVSKCAESYAKVGNVSCVCFILLLPFTIAYVE